MDPENQKGEFSGMCEIHGNFLPCALCANENAKNDTGANTTDQDTAIDKEKSKQLILKEELEKQINELSHKNLEAQKIREQISNKINKIIEQKGYNKKISDVEEKILNTEDVFAKTLIPNKETGLANLTKIMEVVNKQENTPAKQKNKELLNSLIEGLSFIDKSQDGIDAFNQKIKSLHDFKFMISEKEFSNLFPEAGSIDGHHSKLLQEKNNILNEKNTDPEIIELNKQYSEAQNIIEENGSYKIEALQKQLTELL